MLLIFLDKDMNFSTEMLSDYVFTQAEMSEVKRQARIMLKDTPFSAMWDGRVLRFLSQEDVEDGG